MFIEAIAALLLIAQAPETRAPVQAPPPPAAAPQHPVFDQIDAAMEPWKGKRGERLRGRLGLSTSTQTAANGYVVVWDRKLESTACGVDANGVMRCGSVGDLSCRFALAFDQKGLVTEWKAMGYPEACEAVLRDIGAP